MEKIYNVHCDAIPEGKDFDERTDDEIIELSEKETLLVEVYYGLRELVMAWNDGEIFDPDFSFMRIIDK